MGQRSCAGSSKCIVVKMFKSQKSLIEVNFELPVTIPDTWEIDPIKD